MKGFSRQVVIVCPLISLLWSVVETLRDLQALAHFKIVSFERNKAVKSCCDLLERKRFQKILANLRNFWTERTGKMENRTPTRDCVDDIAVTSIYWETVIKTSYSQPEKELMLAVLKDAIMIYKKQIHSGNALFKEAETWLFDRERDWLFSFGSVCAVLGLSSEKIRQNLLAWKLNNFPLQSINSAKHAVIR